MAELEYEAKEQAVVLLKYDPQQATGTCLFSRFRVVDKDGDYTYENFLPRGAVVPLLIAHAWSEIPVGKGKIRIERDGAYFDFSLADTPRGRELREWLRHDLDSYDGPVSEWSYGFSPYPDAMSREMIDGKSVRVLGSRPDGSPGCVVHEASYCLRGAGIGTALVDLKGQQKFRWSRRHAELNAIVQATQREEQAEMQAEMQALYDQFDARQREIFRR